MTRTPASPMPASLRRTRPPQLAIECPYCHARPGERCTSPRGRTLAAPHPSRLDAAKEPTS